MSQLVYGEAVEYIMSDPDFARRRTELRMLLRAITPYHKTALALVRTHDTIYHENLQVRQHGEAPPSGQVNPRCGMGRLPHHPDGQGSMRRSQGSCRQSRVYLASL